MRDSGERLDLGLVGEEDVDAAAVDQLVEAVAVTIDTERVRQSERTFPISIQ